MSFVYVSQSLRLHVNNRSVRIRSFLEVLLSLNHNPCPKYFRYTIWCPPRWIPLSSPRFGIMHMIAGDCGRRDVNSEHELYYKIACKIPERSAPYTILEWLARGIFHGTWDTGEGCNNTNIKQVEDWVWGILFSNILSSEGYRITWFWGS